MHYMTCLNYICLHYNQTWNWWIWFLLQLCVLIWQCVTGHIACDWSHSIPKWFVLKILVILVNIQIFIYSFLFLFFSKNAFHTHLFCHLTLKHKIIKHSEKNLTFFLLEGVRHDGICSERFWKQRALWCSSESSHLFGLPDDASQITNHLIFQEVAGSDFLSWSWRDEAGCRMSARGQSSSGKALVLFFSRKRMPLENQHMSC